jgi:flavin-dependent dehydrogenase
LVIAWFFPEKNVSNVQIIGGGPAGSSAAIRLARQGADVTLFEKSHFPRQKLCGGYLDSAALAELADLDVLIPLRKAGAHSLSRMVIASMRGTCVEAPLKAEVLSVNRSVLDTLLIRQAEARGVDIRWGVDGFHNSIPADYTVVAAGRHVHRGRGPSYVGLQATFTEVRGMTDQIELDWVSSGYVGLARQTGGTVNVCALTTPSVVQRWGPHLDAVLRRFIVENPVLKNHLSSATQVSPWITAGAVRMGIRRLTESNTFYVGDAACVVDPFAGEGMSMALHASRLLSRALMQSDPLTSYRQFWNRAFRSALRRTSLIRRLYNVPWIREPAIQLIHRLPESLTWLTEHTRYEAVS